MTVQTRSVAGAGAVDLGVYFAPALAFGSYMGEPGAAGRRRTPGPDAVVWEGHEVFGSAAARMGITPGEGVSIEALGRLMVGQHVKTGEQLTRQRAAPVYERDASGRYLKDADGNKIRTLDADGKPVSDTSHSTQVSRPSPRPRSVWVSPRSPSPTCGPRSTRCCTARTWP